ncbi:MAG: UDP-N-acetylglucosamine 2-epimerase (non-hydrolyzing), partial [Cutibacterium avidum]|nr:UDP-N-acetylglucosamine 2-epimerase (non-hydrolyzing) [Cutibacterium avidum]
TETEWVETVENGWNVLDPDAEHLAEYATRPHPEGDPGHPYGDGKAAANVAKVLLEAGKRD